MLTNDPIRAALPHLEHIMNVRPVRSFDGKKSGAHKGRRLIFGMRRGLAPRRAGICRYLAIPTPSSQPVWATIACCGGVMLRVFMSVPPTARIR